VNIGGFSDHVFEVLSSFVTGGAGKWVDIIEEAK